MKKLYTLASIILLASLILAACGGTSATEEPMGETPTEAPAPAEGSGSC